ncbi:MAG: hypothetical protein AB7H80_17255 [Candidatus Kapaibacterium sp.]
MMSLHSVKRLILLFWALFFTIVVAANLSDMFREMGLFSPEWPFASGNFGYIQKVIEIYSLPNLFAWTAYSIILLFELTIATLFWKGFRNSADIQSSNGGSAITPFGAALLLWMFFVLSDEFFITYERLPGSEGGHFTGLIAQAATLLLFLFVPQAEKK